MTDLSTLIPRIEQAGPDEQRELLREAFACVLGAPTYYHPKWSQFRQWVDTGAYLDAAMMLVPEGRDWMADNFDGPHDRRCSASVFNAKGTDYADYKGFARTPPMALLAAICRAHIKEGEDAG